MDASAGEGAVFTIELPVGAPRGATAAAGEPKRPVYGRNILVVDDEPAVAAVLAEALTTEEHVVETAESGAVALEKLAARAPRLAESSSSSSATSSTRAPSSSST